MILNSHFSRTSCPYIFTWDRHGVDDQIYSRSERMRQFLRQPSPFADSLIWFPGLRVRPWKCCGWSIGPYACFVPPSSSHPNLAAKSTPKTQCGCTSGVSKLETSSKSVVSISRLPDRETKGRQNEFRVKVLLYFLFIAAIHSLPLCPPPFLPGQEVHQPWGSISALH